MNRRLKSVLAYVLSFALVLTSLGMANPLAFAEDAPTVSDDYYYKAFRPAQTNDSFSFYFDGTNFDQLALQDANKANSYVGLYEVGGNENLVEVVAVHQKTLTEFRGDVKLMQNLSTAKSYEWRLMFPSDLVISKPFEVVDITYGVRYTSLPIGKSQFFMFMYTTGYDDTTKQLLLGKTINVFDVSDNTLIATGTIQMIGNEFFANMNVEANKSITDQTQAYFLLDEGTDSSKIACQDMSYYLSPRNQIFISLKHEALSASYDQAVTEYDFAYYVYGVSQLADIATAKIMKNGVDFIDLKADQDVTYTFEAGNDLSPDIVHFKVPKSKFDDFSASYEIAFRDAQNSGTSNGFNLPDPNGGGDPGPDPNAPEEYTLSIPVRSQGEKVMFKYAGPNTINISEVALEEWEGNALVESHDVIYVLSKDAYRYEADVVLKSDLSTNKNYQWKITYADNSTKTFAVTACDVTYQFNFAPLPTGRSEFGIMVYTNGDNRLLSKDDDQDQSYASLKLMDENDAVIGSGVLIDEGFGGYAQITTANPAGLVGTEKLHVAIDTTNVQGIAGADSNLNNVYFNTDKLVTIDHKAIHTSAGDQNSPYKFVMLNHGIQDLSQFSEVKLNEIVNGQDQLKFDLLSKLADPQSKISVEYVPGQWFDRLVFNVDKSLLERGTAYNLYFAQGNNASSYGTFEIPMPMQVNHVSMEVLTPLKQGDFHYFDVFGTNLDQVNADLSGIWRLDQNGNLDTKIANLEFVDQFYDKIFTKYKATENLMDKTAQYQLVLTNGVTTVTKPLTLVDVAYNAPDKPFTVGKEDFYMPLFVRGDFGLMENKAVTFYDGIDVQNAQVVGTGTVKKLPNGFASIWAEMNAPVQAGQEFHMVVDSTNAAISPEFATQLKGSQAANTLYFDDSALSASRDMTNNVPYALKVYGYGLSSSVSDYTKLTLGESGSDQTIDLKALIGANKATLSKGVDGVTGMDYLMISLDKDQFEFIEQHNYKWGIELQNINLDAEFWIAPALSINDDYWLQATAPLKEGDRTDFQFIGTSMSQIGKVELMNAESSSAVSTDLQIYNHDDGVIRGSLKITANLDKTKGYYWRITSKEGKTITKPFYVCDATYGIGYEVVPVGRMQFITELYTTGGDQLDQLIGKTVGLYKPDTNSWAQGEVVNLYGSFYVQFWTTDPNGIPADADVVYELHANGANIKRQDSSYNLAVKSKILVGVNREAWFASANDVTKPYSLEVLNYGFSSLDDFTNVKLVEETDQNPQILDLKALAKVQNSGVVVSPSSTAWVSILNIEIDRDVLKKGANYHIELSGPDFGESHIGTFTTTGDFTIDYVSVAAMSELKSNSMFNAFFNGSSLGQIDANASGVFEVDANSNALEKVATMQMRHVSNDHINADFTVLNGKSMVKGKTYAFVLTDGTVTHSSPINIASLVYSFNSTPLIVDKQNFLMRLYFDGDGELWPQVAGAQVNCYSDVNKSLVKGTGTVVEHFGNYFVDVHLNEPVQSATELYFEIQSNGLDIADRNFPQTHGATSTALVFDKGMALVGSNFEFTLYGYNLDNGLVGFNEVVLNRWTDPTGQVNLKTLQSGVSTLVAPASEQGLEGLQKLTIRLNQAADLIDESAEYELLFRTDNDAYGLWFMHENFKATHMELNAVPVNDWRYDNFAIFGTNMQSVTQVALYEKTGNQDVLIKTLDMNDKHNDHVRVGLEINPEMNLQTAKNYVIKVTDGIQTFELPINVCDVVFNNSNLILGKDKFYSRLYLGGDYDAQFVDFDVMLDSEVSLYLDKEKTNKVAVALIKKPINNIYVLDVDLIVDPSTLHEGDWLYASFDETKLATINAKPVYNQGMYVGDKEVIFFDQDGIVEDLADETLSTVTIDLYGYGFSNEAGQLTMLKLRNDKTNVEVDLLPLIQQNKVSVAMTTDGVQELQKYSITVDKTAYAMLPESSHTLMLNVGGFETNHGFYVNSYITSVREYNLHNLSPLKATDRFYLWMNGSKLDTIQTFEFREVGTNVNLATPLFDGNKDEYSFGSTFEIMDGVTLDVNKTYEFVLTKTNGTTIQLPVAVKDHVYSVDQHSLQVGMNKFIIPIYLGGNEVDLGGKIVKFYSDEQMQNLLFAGSVVANKAENLTYIKGQLPNGQLIDADTTLFYKIESATPVFEEDGLNMFKATDWSFVASDYRAFENSLASASLDYEFRFYGLGFSNNLNAYSNVFIEDNSNNNASILDLKALALNNPTKISITVDKTAADYEVLVIKVKKDALQLVPDHKYSLIFSIGTDKYGYGYNVEKAAINWTSPMALDKIDAYPLLWFGLDGIYSSDGLSIELFEKGTEGDSSNNLITQGYTSVDFSNRTGSFDYTLKPNVTLDLQKTYLLKVTYMGQVVTHQITLVDKFNPDFNEDGKYDQFETDVILRYYNRTKDDEGFDPYVDLNNDFTIDLYDMVMMQRLVEE